MERFTGKARRIERNKFFPIILSRVDSMNRMIITNKFTWRAFLILCLLCIHQVSADPSTHNWHEVAMEVHPSKTVGASLAFDQKNKQLILFGGQYNNGKYSNATWVWEGREWKRLSPETNPPGRRCASMAFDPKTQQLLLFGGEGKSVFNDTWIWNGSNWIRQSPANSPSIRSHASMALDPVTGQLLLFGGAGGGIFDGRFNLNETWTWNGSTWVELFPETIPSSRHGSGMSFANVTHQLLLFGGQGDSDVLNDTWTWNGKNWVQLFPETHPQKRCYVSLAFDPANDQLLLFGGEGDEGFFNDTWTWNGATWIKLSTQSSPTPRMGASLAYDELHKQLVLFGGGFGRSNVLQDTWLWVPLPIITSVTPSSGSINGEGTVIINGANFDSVLSIHFGSQPVTSFTVDSPTQITVNLPPSATSKLDEPVVITVTTAYGTSLPSTASHFTYVEPITPAPIITHLSSHSGSTDGGHSITIAGEHFVDVEAVFFGTEQATSFFVNSANEITAVAPAQSAGKVAITVQTKHGNSTASHAHFTYVNSDPILELKDDKEKDKEKDIEKSIEKEIEKQLEKEKEHEKDKGKDIEKEIEKHFEHEKEKEKEKEKDKGKNKEPDVVSPPAPESQSILPPLHVNGTQKVKVLRSAKDEICKGKRNSLFHIDIVNILSWKANPEGLHAVAYKIYRNPELTDLVGVVDSDQELKLKDKYWNIKTKKNITYTYFIVAEDAFGRLSSPASVAIEFNIEQWRKKGR